MMVSEITKLFIQTLILLFTKETLTILEEKILVLEGVSQKIDHSEREDGTFYVLFIATKMENCLTILKWGYVKRLIGRRQYFFYQQLKQLIENFHKDGKNDLILELYFFHNQNF